MWLYLPYIHFQVFLDSTSIYFAVVLHTYVLFFSCCFPLRRHIIIYTGNSWHLFNTQLCARHSAKECSLISLSNKYFEALTASAIIKKYSSSILFFAVVVQLPSCIWLFATPWTAGLPGPSPSPKVGPSSCPLKLWWYPPISSSKEVYNILNERGY